MLPDPIHRGGVYLAVSKGLAGGRPALQRFDAALRKLRKERALKALLDMPMSKEVSP